MKKIKYLPLSWPNGLKLTGQHFIHTHNEIVERFQHLREEQTTSYNYGLGPISDGQTAAIELDIAGQSAEGTYITLRYCNAITQTGHSILYDEALYGSYRPQVSLSNFTRENVEDKLYIVVKVSPFETVPVGFPDPETIPLHHPYVLPKIELCIIPTGAANEQFFTKDYLIVGCGKIEGHFFALDSNYIPPTQRLGYNQILRRDYQGIISRLQQILTNITLIYGKNNEEGKKSRLTSSLFAMCMAVQSFASQHFFDLEHLVVEQAPIFFFQKINILARSISNAIHNLSGRDFELLLQYIYEWTDISPSEFETSLNAVVSQRYSHLQIANTLYSCNNLIQKLHLIFWKMSELEYVGLIRENIIISDDSYQEQEKTRKSFRFLD